MKCQVFPPNEPSAGILNSLDLPETKEERDRETSRSPMPINSCQDRGAAAGGRKGVLRCQNSSSCNPDNNGWARVLKLYLCFGPYGGCYVYFAGKRKPLRALGLCAGMKISINIMVWLEQDVRAAHHSPVFTLPMGCLRRHPAVPGSLWTRKGLCCQTAQQLKQKGAMPP